MPFSVEETSKKLIESINKAQQEGKYRLEECSKILMGVDYFLKGTTNEHIKDDLSAFQLLINAVEVAQSRGAFSLEESNALWLECVKLIDWSKEVQANTASTSSERA